MKVVITGAKGFIGRELVSQCIKNNIEVISIDQVETKEKDYFKADILSRDIYNLIPEGVDVIIHLAALSSDKACKDKAYDCFNVNVFGTLNLIEAAKNKGVKQFIFASTEWVYTDFKDNEIKNEESFIDILKHKSEYALSKLISEANLKQQYDRGFCHVTILRFGIVYGLREQSGSAIESLFRDVKTKEIIEVGSLNTGRCFIEISDLVSGIINSIGLKGFNIINLQGDKFVTIGDIIEISKKILNKNPKVMEKDKFNSDIKKVSNEKAKKLLNWYPNISLETGLERLNYFLLNKENLKNDSI